MPTNRTRRARSRALDLDEHKRDGLLLGPDAMLLAGLGYWRLVDRTATAEDKSATLDEMRRDWRIHREALLAHWQGLPRPWAAHQFDGRG